MTLAAGTVLKGNILLVREIGHGMMGTVYLAQNRSLGSDVAVKVLRPAANDSQAAQRFAQEARGVARIDSPHVVKIFDYGITPAGEPFFVMELLRGTDLRARIEQSGHLPLETTATIVRQICSALTSAHALGTVHRDVKPANVFLHEGGGDVFVKLLDFGVAKQAHGADMSMTSTGMMMGTPYYMSPEQLSSPKTVDHRSDLWSTAVVAYACLTGTLPFLGETIGAISVAAHRGQFAPPSTLRPDLPADVDAWFVRALSPRREDRFQSAKELAEAFDALGRRGSSQPGAMLAGKYRVERVLGQGAMGMVVAAVHVDLQEMRAIKLMLPSALEAAEQQERFLREARAAARLKSQHAAKVYDFGRFEDGTPYIVMELLEGMDLKACLDSRRTLPVPEAVTYMLQACEAIAEAHAAGIVHRDLKPANIFLTQGVGGAPCIKVLDFGIAKMSSAAGEGVGDMTKTSELLGTPLYMSPEQMRSTRTVDARTDVWALGVILYRTLTGKMPFIGTTITEVCSAVIADAPAPPTSLRADIPLGLEAVILRCLAKNAAARFENAYELATALAPFACDEPAAASSGPSPRPLKIQTDPIPPPLSATPGYGTLGPAARPPMGSYPELAPRPPMGSYPELAPRPPMGSYPDSAPRPPMGSYPEAAPRPPMPSQSDVSRPPMGWYPDAVPRPSMPSQPDVVPALGQTTTRGASWTQPVHGEARRSRAGLWAAGGVAVVALAGAAFLLRAQFASDAGAGAAEQPGEPPSTPSAEPEETPVGTIPPPVSIDPPPTAAPTVEPSSVPEAQPSPKPIAAPTVEPSSVPEAQPSPKPTAAPVAKPSSVPAAQPAPKPTAGPGMKSTATTPSLLGRD